MDEYTARRLLGKAIQPDGTLRSDFDSGDDYIVWSEDGPVCLDGAFTADQLEALAWWLRNGADPLVHCKKAEIPGRDHLFYLKDLPEEERVPFHAWLIQHGHMLTVGGGYYIWDWEEWKFGLGKSGPWV